ncbi:MAG: hypothetical protein HYR85_08380 [Planctomycetes bacterium]|nr:hypothetical protein [Planctomycetota bacterium]
MAVVLLLGLVIVTLAAQQLDRWVGGRGVSRAILRGISTAPLLTVADVKYRVERVSLVVHRQLCMALVFVALLGLFLPTAVLIAGPSASHERGANPVGNSFLSLRLFCWVVALVAAVAALFKASNGVWLVFTHAGDFARLARDARTMPLKFRCLAIIEGLARLTVGAVAILYVWTTIGVATDILHLSALPQYELMFERVALIDQGVSPLVPLLLIGGGILTWSVWNLVRTQSLAETTSYEGSRDVATPHTPLPNGPESIRGRLECAIPTTWAVAFLLFLIALGAWLYSRFQPTVEGIVPFVGDEKRLPLPWFDILLRLGILGMLFAITWSFFRFVAVWDSLRTILQSHENPWFLAACDRAKEHLTAATLVNLWFPQAAGQIENTSRELWESVREHAWRVTTLAPTPTTAFKIAAQNFPKRSPANAVGESERGTTVMVVWSHLVATRRGEHAALTQMPAPMPSHLAALNETAEEFVALQFIEFVEWVTRQLRGLAIYLLVSIALLTLLLCSYPLYPQTVFRLVFLLIIASGISAVMFIVTQMNKNVVLSRITGTAPGVTTWDRTFVSNVVFLGLVPLLLFLCSVFPDVRQFFFAWIDPLLKVFVKA